MRRRWYKRSRYKRYQRTHYGQYFHIGIELGFECTIMIDNIKHLAKIKVENDKQNADLSDDYQTRHFENSFTFRKDFYYWPAIVCESCNCGKKRSIPSRQFQVSWE